MASLTAQDMLSRTRKKGWVNRTEREDGMLDAQDAREAAAEKIGRNGRHRSPLYDSKAKEEE